MSINNEIELKKKEEQILKKLNLSGDVLAFKNKEEHDYNEAIENYLKTKNKNNKIEKTSAAVASIGLIGYFSGFLSVPAAIATAVVSVGSLAYKDYDGIKSKEYADSIKDFDSSNIEIEELLLSEEFQTFKKENDKDYQNSLNQIMDKQNKWSLALNGSLFPLIGGGLLMGLGVATAPIVIASAGVFAASSLALYNESSKKDKLNDKFDLSINKEMSKLSEKYSDIFNALNSEISNNAKQESNINLEENQKNFEINDIRNMYREDEKKNKSRSNRI